MRADKKTVFLNGLYQLKHLEQRRFTFFLLFLLPPGSLLNYRAWDILIGNKEESAWFLLS